jgi:NAD(P)H-dependent FMN reductase
VVLGHAKKRVDAEYTVVDIAEYNLPLFDESIPPRMSLYQGQQPKAWATVIDRSNAFVFVTPEYNHSISAALKNAIDHLFREWQHKVAGFVSIGADKGVRAVEHLRQIVGELAMADVRAKVALSLRSDFENFSDFKPRDHHVPLLNAMLDEVVLWEEAIKFVRETHRFNLMGQPIERMRPISHAGPGPSNSAPDLQIGYRDR